MVSSLEIASMASGQQVMFSNNASYAQQIGSQYFGGQQAAPLQPVNFGSSQNYGASVAGGIGHAIPEVLGIGAMAAGMSGIPGIRALDPWSTVPSAFRAGTGARAGAGFMGTMGHIGSAIQSEGLGAGARMIGGGLARAALPAAAFYAVGKGAEYVGEQIYQGAENISRIGDVTSRIGPFYGQQGTRAGGGMGRQQIQQIGQVLHGLADQDVATSGESMMRTFEKLERQGLFMGSVSPQQITERIKKAVTQVKAIAQMLGTTMDEAAPLLGDMQRMGLWTSKDIMGTAAAIRAVGPQNAGALMGSMQAGAQGSWARGGTLAAGAQVGREAFMGVQAAMSSGVISDERLREITGGTGGVQGQQMAAGMLGEISQNAAGTPMGRLMMAALGEQKGGRFTGRIDQQLMQRFQSGGFTLDQLQQMAHKKTRTREQAASYTTQGAKIGQAMAAEGPEATAQATQMALERAGMANEGEDIQNIMIQKLMGVGQREADTLQLFMKELPRIQEEKQNRMRASIKDSLRQQDIRRNRSIQGLRDVIDKVWEKAVQRPLEEIGDSLATNIGKSIDDYQNELLRSSEQAEGLGIKGAGGASVFGENARTGSGILERARRGLTQARGHGLSGAWQAITNVREAISGGAEGGMGRGATARYLLGATKEYGEGATIGEGEAVLGASGGKMTTGREQDIQMAARRAQSWARSETSLSDLGFSKDTASTAEFSTLQREMNKLLSGRMAGGVEELERLRSASGGNESKYMRMLLEKLKSESGDARGALDKLGKMGQSTEDLTTRQMSLAVQAAKTGGSDAFPSMADRSQMAAENAESAMEHEPTKYANQAKKFNEMTTGALRSRGEESFMTKAAGVVGGMYVQGVGLMANMFGLGALGIAAAVKGDVSMLWAPLTKGWGAGQDIGKGLKNAMSPDSVKELESMLADEATGDDLREFMIKGDSGSGAEARDRLLKKSEAARRIIPLLDNMRKKDPGMSGVMAITASLAKGANMAQGSAKQKWENSQMAKAELAALEKMTDKDISPALRDQYKEVLKQFEAGTPEEARQAASRMATSMVGQGKDISSMLALGGDVSRGIAGQAMIREMGVMGGGMSAGALGGRLRRISGALGFDVESKMTDEEKKLMASFREDKRITSGESARISGILSDVQARTKRERTVGKGETADEKNLDIMTKLSESQKDMLAKQTTYNQVTSNAIVAIKSEFAKDKGGGETTVVDSESTGSPGTGQAIGDQ